MAQKFSAINAAFSGIAFIKNNREFSKRIIGFYALFYFLYCLVLANVGYFDQLKVSFEVMANIGKVPAYVPTPPSQQYNLALVILSILGNLVYIVCIGAILRKMVRQEEIGFHGFAWGKDENRLFISVLILFAIYIVFVLALTIIGTIVAIPFAIAAAGAGKAGASGAMFGTIATIAVIAMTALIAFFTRYCQFGVLTIARRKTGVIDSWNETSQFYWSFLSANSIVFIATFVLQGVMFYIGYLLYKNIGTDAVFFGQMHPLWFVLFAMMAAIYAVMLIFMCSTGAYAYHIMHDGEDLAQESEKTDNVWPKK